MDIYYDFSAITDLVQVGIWVVDLADPDAEPIAVTSATRAIAAGATQEITVTFTLNPQPPAVDAAKKQIPIVKVSRAT